VTGRRDDEAKEADEIEVTPEMIEAGAKELVFDSELIRVDVAKDIIVAALEAGGFRIKLIEY
jgi:hypothetical protein